MEQAGMESHSEGRYGVDCLPGTATYLEEEGDVVGDLVWRSATPRESYSPPPRRNTQPLSDGSSSYGSSGDEELPEPFYDQAPLTIGQASAAMEEQSDLPYGQHGTTGRRSMHPLSEEEYSPEPAPLTIGQACAAMEEQSDLPYGQHGTTGQRSMHPLSEEEYSPQDDEVIFDDLLPTVLEEEDSDAVSTCTVDYAPLSTHILELTPEVLAFTQRPYDYLDSRKRQHRRRRQLRASLPEISRTMSPLKCLIRRRSVSIATLGIAAATLYFPIANYQQHQKPIEGKAFRITPIELRSGASGAALQNTSHSSHSSHFSHCAILRSTDNGCLVHEWEGARLSNAAGESCTVALDRVLPLAGFAVSTSLAPPQYDPIRFSLSAQDEGGQWSVVAHPRWRVSFAGIRYPQPLATPEQRGREVVVDLRSGSDFQWVMGRVGGGLAVGLGLAGAAVGGLVGMEHRGVQALVAFWGLASLCMFAAAVSLAVNAKGEEACMWALYCAVVGGGAAGFKWRERDLARIGAGVGGAMLFVDVLSHFSVLDGTFSGLDDSLSFPLLASALLLCSAVLAVLAQGARAEVAQQIQPDQEAYDAMWERLCAADTMKQQVGRLERIVEGTRCSVGGEGAVFQRHKPGASLEEASLSQRVSWWVRRSMAHLRGEGMAELIIGPRVRSLDQLYAQATCLRPILKAKVQEWALRTKGMFRTQQGMYMKWEDVTRGVVRETKVLWTSLKDEDRSIEKALQCYEGDVSQLVDICRETIVFANLSELCDCFQLLSTDPEVEVVRVKNRMSLDHESECNNGGLRHVCINLRLRNEDSRRFGVETFIAELHLVLLSFRWLQEEGGRHARYVAFRSLARPRPPSLPPFAKQLLSRLTRHLTRPSPSPPAEEGREGGREEGGPRRRRRERQWWRSVDSLGSLMRVGQDHLTETLPEYGEARTRQRLNSEVSLRSSLYADCAPSIMSLDRLPAPVNAALEFRVPSKIGVLAAFRELMYRRNTSTKGRHGHLRDFWRALEQMSWSSVLFIRHPVEGAFTKPIWRVVATMTALLGLTLCLGSLSFVFNQGHTYRHFRFTSLASRYNYSIGSNGAAIAGIADFGVASHGCFRPPPESMEFREAVVQISYYEPVWMNSFWIRTSNASVDFDPVRFKIEGSRDKRHWHTVDSSTGSSGFPPFVYHTFGFHNTSLARLDLLVFNRDIAPVMQRGFGFLLSHYWILGTLQFLSITPVFFAIVITCIRAGTGKLGHARVVATGMFCTALLLLLFCTTACRTNGCPSRRVWVLAVSFLLAAIILWRWQEWAVSVAPLFLVTSIALKLLGHGPHEGLFLDHELIIWLFLLGSFGTAVAARAYIIVSSRRAVRVDNKQYDAIWQSVLSEEAVQIERLRTLTYGKPSAVPRHYYNPFVETAPSAPLGLGMNGCIPVKDIDQIYAQATCLLPVLRKKVQDWAVPSHGMLATHDKSFVCWGEVASRLQERAKVRWCSVKNETRAIEKVVRCYGEDVSRLVDVCRESLVFGTVGELCDCFQLLSADPEVEVVRVKNRMSPEHQPGWSGGLRHVTVNLRLRDEDSRRFGVDSHVCEVQLMLLSFAELRAQPEAHQRYIRVRNLRVT